MAQRALDIMLVRVTDPSRKTFGKGLHEHGKLARLWRGLRGLNPFAGTVIANIAKSRAEIESARLLVLSAAYQVRFHELRPFIRASIRRGRYGIVDAVFSVFAD